MKSVHELSAEELQELRSNYFHRHLADDEIEENDWSYESEEEIPMEEVINFYEGTYFVEEDFFCNLDRELTPQEQLFEWWQLLPFEAKEEIHHIKLMSLNDESTEEALDECREDWFDMEDEQRINHFINLYARYINFVGDRFDKLFDELYNS